MNQSLFEGLRWLLERITVWETVILVVSLLLSYAIVKTNLSTAWRHPCWILGAFAICLLPLGLGSYLHNEGTKPGVWHWIYLVGLPAFAMYKGGSLVCKFGSWDSAKSDPVEATLFKVLASTVDILFITVPLWCLLCVSVCVQETAKTASISVSSVIGCFLFFCEHLLEHHKQVSYRKPVESVEHLHCGEAR